MELSVLVRTALIAVLIAWVSMGAVRRGRNWLAWALVISVTDFVGVLVWLVVRRRSIVVAERLDARHSLAIRFAAIPLAILWTVLTTFITTFLVQVARVEGRSMEPTLSDLDRLLVNKFVYLRSAPRRRDVVMLHYPSRPEKKFVSRVMAEEGDQVALVDGNVYVNDVALDDSFVLPENRSHDNWGPNVIPEGYYFVMGDRRNNSSDSRHWGFVPKKYIVGRVQYRWWPVSTARTF